MTRREGKGRNDSPRNLMDWVNHSPLYPQTSTALLWSFMDRIARRYTNDRSWILGDFAFTPRDFSFLQAYWRDFSVHSAYDTFTFRIFCAFSYLRGKKVASASHDAFTETVVWGITNSGAQEDRPTNGITRRFMARSGFSAHGYLTHVCHSAWLFSRV
jgi:hypothetical protein